VARTLIPPAGTERQVGPSHAPAPRGPSAAGVEVMRVAAEEPGAAATRAARVWRGLLRPGRETRLEVHVRTLRRLRTVAAVAVPVHLAHLVVFGLDEPTSAQVRTWRTGILVAHGVLLVLMLGVTWAASAGLRAPTRRWARALPWAVLVLWLGAGTAIAALDQLVTQSITPFLVANVVAGLVLVVPPVGALTAYLGGLGAFSWAMAATQTDPSVSLSNRVNGVTAAALGFGLVLLQWHSEVRDVDKSRRIAAQRVQLEAHNAELGRLASHDPLTGLVNRRRFDLIAAHEVVTARREARPLSLLSLDVDHFKRINDRYGHLAGDELLRALAELLEGRLRERDVVARWGGEEFLVLLPGTDLAGAAAIAEQLRGAVAGASLLASHELTVTVSCGVAAVDADATAPIETAYRAADRALYAAKAAGRDRVEVADDVPGSGPSVDGGGGPVATTR
jgi:diguanylate cyclase